MSPVHGVGGVIGSILTGVFMTRGSGGVGYAEGMTMSSQVVAQTLGVVATARAGVVGHLRGILKVIDATVGLACHLRSRRARGLDLAQHGERGYSE